MNSIFVWPGGSDAAAQRIATRVLPHREQFIADLFATTVSGLPELAHDETQRTLLYASIAENTVVLINALQDGTDPSTTAPPPGALAYAKELARKGVSLASLLRAYRIGQAQFTALCLDTASGMEGIDDLTALRVVVGKVAAFIDHICEEVARDYESEREHLISTRSGLTQHLIQRLLDGTAEDLAATQQALGYELAATHLAVDIALAANRAADVSALDEARHLLTALAPRSAKIAMPTGESSLCTWTAVDTAPPKFVECLRATVESSTLPVQVVVGLPAPGVEGFRRTYRQAARLRALSSTADPPPPKIVSFTEIAPIAMLADDLDELTAFVTATLGPLAVDTVRTAELRETMRIYLSCHRSPAATAEKMSMHRNTVRYRIQQVTEEFGDVIDRAEPYRLASALEICRWYGRTVLTPPPGHDKRA
ncbi:PucR family transcriptional regulator [Nocardia farcinica]|uniref:PucR family transcriptional regulator n=1 Tax=Nocardia farcinica TaxID=37329 RepID=UPI00245833A2|nr:helix-turn-helix domain-containing protein [Nocardia farcinica]